MVNLKLLIEKRNDAHRNIQPPRKGSMIENMAGRQSLELEIKYGMCLVNVS